MNDVAEGQANLSKFILPHHVAGLFLNARANRDRIVATSGCFDILHAGHVRFLTRAAHLGDLLVVCVNSDASIRRLKGPGRPIVPLQSRLEVLNGLAVVRFLVTFMSDTPEAVLDLIQPDVWVKGGDYQHKDLPERATIEKYGGRVEILPYVPGHSTTALWAALGNVERTSDGTRGAGC
jgi:D-beta-D-heptose 7-phosphate kinase/D-beta-D-heptose 1-phosphate adenosyltransferase